MFAKTDERLLGRPNGPEGLICPWRGPCVKACRSCVLWDSQPVVENGQQMQQWRCAFNWAAVAGPILARKLDGVQAATEQNRNHTAALREAFGKLIALALGLASGRKPASQPAPVPALDLKAEPGDAGK